MKHYFLTPKFGHSTAEPHLKHHLLTRSSSRWLASQRQVSWQVPGLLIGPHGAIFPICRLMYVCGCAGAGNGKYCCPKIYFNHRCFSGPYLNKGRIAELPQFIGPGNCVLVLKEVSKRGPLLVKAKTQWRSTWKEREIHWCKPLFWGLCVCLCLCEWVSEFSLWNLTYHPIVCSRIPAVLPDVIATVLHRSAPLPRLFDFYHWDQTEERRQLHIQCVD